MLPPGQIVDRYVVEQLLGSGGMATVYRVRHRTLKTLHALKVLTTTAPAVRDRLVVEGQIQAGLRHPNLVAVTDVLYVDGAPALLMEFVDGLTLEAWIGQRRPLPIEEVGTIFLGILAGVSAAHARGLVHRDLKPANVLLDVSGSVPVPRVSDFGIAKVLADDDTPKRRTSTGIMMGTPQYMSPEQYDDAKGVDARADVFALGCILYEMLMGRAAFDYPSVFTTYSAIQAGRWARVETERADVPEAWRAAMAGCLEPDRNARIRNCGELEEILLSRRAPGRSVATAVAAPAPAATILEPAAGIRVTPAGMARQVEPERPPEAGTAPPVPAVPAAPEARAFFYVDTSSEANFWASVARALPARVKTPSQVAEYINRAPTAKNRAPNGSHWTGMDVTAAWVGMPAALGGPQIPAFYVDTSSEADFWASVARALPARAKAPSQVAAFLNTAPRARARAPNGHHWTSNDVTARWVGMSEAFGWTTPVSTPDLHAAKNKSLGVAEILLGVPTLVGILLCVGSCGAWLLGGLDDQGAAIATPTEPPSLRPPAPASIVLAFQPEKRVKRVADRKPSSPSGVAPSLLHATSASRSTRIGESPTSASQVPKSSTAWDRAYRIGLEAFNGDELGARAFADEESGTAPIGHPKSMSKAASKHVLTDRDDILAMARAVINASSPKLQSCYDARLKQVEGLKGTWEASFTIAKDGTATSVHVIGVNGSDHGLDACLAQEISAWQFEPIAEDHAVKKTYHFNDGSW